MSETDEKFNEIDKLNKETELLVAQAMKAAAETLQINKQVKWYEIVLIMTFSTALLAAGKYLFN